MLKMALVGCGLIARAHLHGIRNHAPDVKITATVDSDLERARSMAEETGAEAFDSLETALSKGDFEAVDLMLPHDVHESACVACFEAGKAVLLEKPIANTLASAERILAAARESKAKLMVAEQAQYWTDVIKCRELIDNGYIGDVLTARAYFFDRLVVDPNDPIPWRYSIKRSGGGISIDGGAHWIRPMRMMLGEIESVFAATENLIENMEGESLAHAIFRFESGVLASFQALKSDAVTGPIEDFRITGTKGELITERGRNGRLMAYTSEHPKGQEIMSSVAGKAASYGVEIDDFAKFVLHGGELAAEPEYALGELRTALAMYRSVETGTWEKVWA